MKIVSNYPQNDKKEEFKTYTPIILMFCAIIGILAGYVITFANTEPEEVVEITPTPIFVTEEVEEVAEEEPKEEEHGMTDDDIIAMVVMAEAGNQEMIGKVAVAMTILNRCDAWGKTVEEVINEPNQYTFPYYGTVSAECYRAVEIARENRDLFPDNLFFFRTTKYHEFGEPYLQLEDHYFSLGSEE